MNLRGRKRNTIIIGNGCAAAECIISMRDSGYRDEICLFTDNRWPIANPMLTTYFAAGKIDFEGLFPYGPSTEFYKKYAVEVYHESPVIALDAEYKIVASSSGVEFGYDQCLIASGTTPILPPFEGIDSNRVYTMRTVEDAIRLKDAMGKKPKKALVIGASMVGIKLVELFYHAGMEVILADLAQNLFPLAAYSECAQVIEDHLTQKSIKLRLGAAIEKAEETSDGIKAYFKGSAVSEEADLLIMAIGTRANTGFVDKKQVLIDKGIIIDEQMKTNCPGLYAAGDVTQGKNLLSGKHQMIGLWANARYQGRTAGRNMAGFDEFFAGNIPHNITHFMGIDFVGIGNVRDFDRMEQKKEGHRLIQLFWKEGLLTGANFIDCCAEAGVVKSALIKGLRQNGPGGSGSFYQLQNQLIKSILNEVRAHE